MVILSILSRLPLTSLLPFSHLSLSLSRFSLLTSLLQQVMFEMHETNSLSNRFKLLGEVNTEAVLSIDDDLIISCSTLQQAAKVWSANKWSTVGFSPRLGA
jgi:hypothetical protein